MHGWIGPPGLMEVPWGLRFRCQGNKRCSVKEWLGNTNMAAAQATMLARAERYFILSLKDSS